MWQQQVLLVTLTLFGVTSAAPWFCRNSDCPAFDSDDREGYEIRDYEKTLWVAVSVRSYWPDPSRRQSSAMFQALYGYIRGNNDRREKIDMTVPVLTKTQNTGDEYIITMMFYLPGMNSPQPTQNGVYLMTRPAGPVFVRSFPSWWWVSNSVYRDQLAEMKEAVGDSSLYDNTAYYKASYNSPYDYFVRKQHEVWMDTEA